MNPVWHRALRSVSEMYDDLLQPLPESSTEAYWRSALRLRRDWERIGEDLAAVIEREHNAREKASH